MSVLRGRARVPARPRPASGPGLRPFRAELIPRITSGTAFAPHGATDAEPGEPADRQVAVQLRHQLPPGADRERDVQQAGPDQPLGGDLAAATTGAERREAAVAVGGRVRHGPRTDGGSMARFAACRFVRSGCRAGMRASGSAWLDGDPLVWSAPRMPVSAAAPQRADHVLQPASGPGWAQDPALMIAVNPLFQGQSSGGAGRGVLEMRKAGGETETTVEQALMRGLATA